MKNTDISRRTTWLLLSLFVTACSSPVPPSSPQASAQPTPQSTLTPVGVPSLVPTSSPSPLEPVTSPSTFPISTAQPSVQPSASQLPTASPSPQPSSRPAGELQIALNGFRFLNAYALEAELSNSQNQILSRRELRLPQSTQHLGLSTAGLSAGSAYQLQISGLIQTDCLRQVAYRLKPLNSENAGLRSLSADLNLLSFTDFDTVPQSSACLASYELSGVLQDTKKKPIANAQIKATVIRQGQSDYVQVVNTNNSGKYLFDNLPQEGLVLLTIKKVGFADLQSKYLYLEALSRQKLDLVLKARASS